MTNILTLNLILSTLIFGVAARIYLVPRLGDLDTRTVLVPILLLHAFRHLGLMFLSPGATEPTIPSQFAYPAAIGDFIAAVLAMVSVPAVMYRWNNAKPLVWIFNIVGSLDFILAIGLAVTFGATTHMGAAYWIPAFWVPALIVGHVIVFVVLVNHWRL